jgi:hypothetical protein
MGRSWGGLRKRLCLRGDAKRASTLATVRAASPIPSCGGQQQASNEWCKKYRTKEIAPESERPVSANEGNEQTQTEIEQIENHIPCRPPLAAFGASEGRCYDFHGFYPDSCLTSHDLDLWRCPARTKNAGRADASWDALGRAWVRGPVLVIGRLDAATFGLHQSTAGACHGTPRPRDALRRRGPLRG